MALTFKVELFKQQLMQFALDDKEKGGQRLANCFLDAVEDAVASIVTDPLAYCLYHPSKLNTLLRAYEFRKWPLKSFPHNIYFRISENNITLELIYAQAMVAQRMNDDTEQ